MITPPPSGSPAVGSNPDRVLLSLGNNFSWVTETFCGGVESRTFDFFLNSTNYSFGGIRIVQATGVGSPAKQYISDNGAGEAGCQHIRITFFPSTVSERLHYQAFSDDNYKCGWITYTLGVDTGLGGPGGGFVGA